MEGILIRQKLIDRDDLELPMVGERTIGKYASLATDAERWERTLRDAINAVEALENATEGKALSKDDQQLVMNVAKEHFGTTFGLEDYQDRLGIYYAGQALEGFGDIIKTLWAKLRDGFRKLVAFLSDTMARIFNNVSRIAKAAEKTDKHAQKMRKYQPPNGAKTKIIRNKFLFVNGQYDPKGPDRVAGFLRKLNEGIPVQVSDLVLTISSSIASNREDDKLTTVISKLTSTISQTERFASHNVSDSDNPFKRPNTKAQRTDIIAANKALYVVIPTDLKDGDPVKMLNRFQKSFALYLHVVPSMNKAPKGMETNVRSASEISTAMRAVQSAVKMLGDANDVTGNIRRNLDKALNSMKNVSDAEHLPNERRKQIKELMETLSACRRLMGSNIVGTYAICASTLKAHVKQARFELKAYKD